MGHYQEGIRRNQIISYGDAVNDLNSEFDDLLGDGPVSNQDDEFGSNCAVCSKDADQGWACDGCHKFFCLDCAYNGYLHLDDEGNVYCHNCQDISENILPSSCVIPEADISQPGVASYDEALPPTHLAGGIDQSSPWNIEEDEFDDLLGDEPVSNDEDQFGGCASCGNILSEDQDDAFHCEKCRNSYCVNCQSKWPVPDDYYEVCPYCIDHNYLW